MTNTVFMETTCLFENNNFELSLFANSEPKLAMEPIVKELLNETDKIDLTLIKARTMRVHKWNDERANLAIIEYKKLIVMAKLKVHVVPGKDIDEIWHSHILFTKNYIDDCNKYFGYYLHHKPADGSTEQDNEKRKLSHLNMMKKYKIIFCQDPPAIWNLNYNDPCGSMGCDVGCEG